MAIAWPFIVHGFTWYYHFFCLPFLRKCKNAGNFTTKVPWDCVRVICYSHQAVFQKSWTSLSTGVRFGRTTLCSRFEWDQTSSKVSFHFRWWHFCQMFHTSVSLCVPGPSLAANQGFTISRVQDNFQRLSLLNVMLYLFTFFHGLIPVTSSQSL